MKIQHLINHIPPIKGFNILPIKTRLKLEDIIVCAAWINGAFDYYEPDIYDIVCGYGRVIWENDRPYYIERASTKYFPSANHYLTYDSFWCDEPDLNEQLQNMIDDNEYISLGLSPIPTQTIKSIRYEN